MVMGVCALSCHTTLMQKTHERKMTLCQTVVIYSVVKFTSRCSHQVHRGLAHRSDTYCSGNEAVALQTDLKFHFFNETHLTWTPAITQAAVTSLSKPPKPLNLYTAVKPSSLELLQHNRETSQDGSPRWLFSSPAQLKPHWDVRVWESESEGGRWGGGVRLRRPGEHG